MTRREATILVLLYGGYLVIATFYPFDLSRERVARVQSKFFWAVKQNGLHPKRFAFHSIRYSFVLRPCAESFQSLDDFAYKPASGGYQPRYRVAPVFFSPGFLRI